MARPGGLKTCGAHFRAHQARCLSMSLGVAAASDGGGRYELDHVDDLHVERGREMRLRAS